MYGAIPVDDWLSDVLPINDNVVRNTVRIHQVEGIVCANTRHLSVDGTVNATCCVQQQLCLGFKLFFRRKIDIVCSWRLVSRTLQSPRNYTLLTWRGNALHDCA